MEGSTLALASPYDLRTDAALQRLWMEGRLLTPQRKAPCNKPAAQSPIGSICRRCISSCCAGTSPSASGCSRSFQTSSPGSHGRWVVLHLCYSLPKATREIDVCFATSLSNNGLKSRCMRCTSACLLVMVDSDLN